MTDESSLFILGRDIKNYLEYFQSLGVERLPRVTPLPPVSRSLDPDRAESRRPASNEPGFTQAPAATSFGDWGDTLARIRADLGDCRRCRLSEGRTRLVFGEGPDRPVLVFVGLGPGPEEDRAGRPFLGPAGKLLADIVVKGLRLSLEDCYLADVVKCRLPQQRKPFPDEARTCLPFLLRQIRVLRPLAVVALGQESARYLLQTSEPLEALRGSFHDLEGIPVMPTDHPADLLRHPELKRGTWEDVKKVIALVNRLAPGRLPGS